LARTNLLTLSNGHVTCVFWGLAGHVTGLTSKIRLQWLESFTATSFFAVFLGCNCNHSLVGSCSGQ